MPFSSSVCYMFVDDKVIQKYAQTDLMINYVIIMKKILTGILLPTNELYIDFVIRIYEMLIGKEEG